MIDPDLVIIIGGIFVILAILIFIICSDRFEEMCIR